MRVAGDRGGRLLALVAVGLSLPGLVLVAAPAPGRPATTGVAAGKQNPSAVPRAPTKGSIFTFTARLDTPFSRPVVVQRKAGGRWAEVANTSGYSRANGKVENVLRLRWHRAALRVHADRVRHHGRWYAATDTQALTIRALPLSNRLWSGTLAFDYASRQEQPYGATTAHDVATVTVRKQLDDPGQVPAWIQAASVTGSVSRSNPTSQCENTASGSFAHTWRVGFHLFAGGVRDFDRFEGYVGGESGSLPNGEANPMAGRMATNITTTQTCVGLEPYVSQTDLFDVLSAWGGESNPASDGVCSRAMQEGLYDAFQDRPRTHVGTTSGSLRLRKADAEYGLSSSCTMTWQLTRLADSNLDGVPD